MVVRPAWWAILARLRRCYSIWQLCLEVKGSTLDFLCRVSFSDPLPFKFNSNFRLFFNFVISVQLNIFLNLDRAFWKFRNGRGRLAKGIDVECDSLTVRDDGTGGMICRFGNALTDGQFLVEQLVVVWDGGRIGMLLDAS